jgi:hypothetical protein
MLKFKEYSQELDIVAETIELTTEELQQIDEVLDTAGRLKRKASFIRRKARISLARKMQAKRLATPDRLKGRAKTRAKSLLVKRMYQGRSMGQIPISQRAQVSKKLARMKGSIKRISTKLMRRVKQDDIARKTGNYKKVKSSSSNGAL